MTRTKIDTIEVDATISEKPTRKMEITEHPVEDGSDLADHSRVVPEIVVIVGSISDIDLGGTRTGLSRRQPGWADLQRAALEDLQDSHVVFDVQTSRKVYRDMMLSELTWESNAKTGGELSFTATCKSVVLVTNQGLVLTRPPPPATTTQQPNGTEQQPKQAGQQTDDSTIAKGFFNSLGVTQVGSGRPN